MLNIGNRTARTVDGVSLVSSFLYSFELCRVVGDVGGALGLFLGASLLTIIELIYLCCQYGIMNKRRFAWPNFGRDNKTRRHSTSLNEDNEDKLIAQQEPVHV